MTNPFFDAALAVVGLLCVAASLDPAAADDWTVAGTILSPSGIIADGAMTVSGQRITAVGPGSSASASAIKVRGIILPGFIDLHNHLTWNVLPRWVPGRTFADRYAWQDTAEYDRVLVTPHTLALNAAACRVGDLRRDKGAGRRRDVGRREPFADWTSGEREMRQGACTQFGHGVGSAFHATSDK